MSRATLSDADRALLTQSLFLADERRAELYDAFFPSLFARHPEVEPLFGAWSVTEKMQMVHRMLTSVLASMDREAWLAADLEALGARHESFEVETAMYDQVNICFVEALASLSGEAWSDDLARLWMGELGVVSEAMCPPLATRNARFRQSDLLSLDLHTDDPWDLYQWMRDTEPLFWDPKNEIWAVSRYADVVHVSRRTDLFCSGNGVIPTLSLDIWPDEAMINLDGQAHTCQRGLVAKGFTPRRIAGMEDTVRSQVNLLVDRLEQTGSFDLVKDFSRPLPFRIIAGMLGYPEDKVDQVLDWTDTYCMGGCGPEHVTEEVVEAFANFAMFHEELLAQKKACPGEDLLNVWLRAELDGQRLSEEKLMYEHNLLLVGGSETTRSAIAIGMQALIAHPDQMTWLRDNLDDPQALGIAVEELIRWSCPFVRMARTATQDVQMHGKTIKKGQQVVMLYPSANRDPRAFDRPDVFDIRRRSDNASLSFGIGKHFCIGASLARMETRIAVETLLRRLPDLHFVEGTEPVRARSSFVRSLLSLPVAFRSSMAKAGK